MGSKHRLLVGGVGTVVVSAGLLAAMFFYQINAPAQGVVDSNSVSGAPVHAFDMSPRLVTGKNVIFQYPAGLDVKPNNPSSSSELEQFNFTHPDIQSWVLAISIDKLSSGLVADNSGLQFRRTKPTIYKESTLSLGNKDITVMTDVTAPGFAKMAFMTNGTRSATVSLFGDDVLGTDNLDKTFTLVLSTWHWQ